MRITHKQKLLHPGYYPVVMDWWVATLIVFGLAGMVLSIPVIIAGVNSVPSVVVLVAFLIGNFLFLVDKAFYTAYFLEEDALVIAGQLRKIVIPYRVMGKVTPGNTFGLLSIAGRKRFALSGKCIYVTLQGTNWKRISLSPERRDEFVNLLLEKIEESRPVKVTFNQLKKR